MGGGRSEGFSERGEELGKRIFREKGRDIEIDCWREKRIAGIPFLAR